MITDSKKETDLGVAYGFPTDELSSSEMYVSDTITDLLQPTDGHLSVYVDAEMVSSGLDMLQMDSSKDKSKLDIRNVLESAIGMYLQYNDPEIPDNVSFIFKIF